MNNEGICLGIYEKAIKPGTFSEIFKTAAKAGFDYIEISLDESDARLARLDWSRTEIERLRADAADAGIRLMSACFSGQRKYSMGSADPAVEKKSMELFEKAVVFCDRVGIRILQVAGYDVYYEAHSPETAERYLNNLYKGTQLASKYGVTLAIETVEVFLDTAQKVLDAISWIGSPMLQAYPDISNLAALGYDPVLEIEKLKGHIAAMHVRDSLPGEFYNVELGTGIIDFNAVFSKAKEIDYMGPFLIEMWYEENKDNFQMLKYAHDFMLEKIREVY